MLGNSWHKKEKPFLGFNGYGGSAAGLVAARASASVEVSSDYLYIPFNKTVPAETCSVIMLVV